MISISIDVTQLDKARFKHITRKNGNKAVFCELVLIETPGGKYGDWMVKESSTKEERSERKEMPIIGNGKWLGQNRSQSGASDGAVAPPANDGAGAGNADDVPF